MFNIIAQLQPVPKDIPLPLPIPEPLLIGLLIFSFLLHILFVNLIVGGSLLTLYYQILGLKEKKYDFLAKEIVSTITVNKSLAVVLGVAPLLCINALYTIYFYSANSLTGSLWISIVPLLFIAFLLAYYHKYNWEKFESNKKVHIGLMALITTIFLFVPLIFLTNINLMLFPEKWGEVTGFFSSMILWNVIPRYFHFVAGSLAVTGLFLFWYFGRKSFNYDEEKISIPKNHLRKNYYKIALYVTLSQVVFGPFVFFTLPWHGVTWNLFYIFLGGIVAAAIAVFLIWRDIKGPEEKLGKSFATVVLLLTITVAFMGYGRHYYRNTVLEPHQKLVKEKTEKFLERSESYRNK
ncbi:MAG: cytochrome C [Ignavibacteria bacterium]|jgi:cytochrome c